ncbi:YD repeat-containing protein [Citrobacter farmeri]|nr:YD repeat-containing protein [Citrobacter farmeri]MCW2423940.1 YD repeat-containing protein [Citrobacter farmeri]
MTPRPVSNAASFSQSLDRLVEQTNPDGCRQAYSYDALGAVTEVVFTGWSVTQRAGSRRRRHPKPARNTLMTPSASY